MMKKAMIAQPMAGKSEEEIRETRERITAELVAKGYEVVNTLFEDEMYGNKEMAARGIKNIGLYLLGKSLQEMSKCDAVYFAKGWENARGCRFERAAVNSYGVEMLLMEDR